MSKSSASRLQRSLDRAIAAVAPSWGLSRAKARQQLALHGDGYEATKPGRNRRTYTGTGGSADRHQDVRTLWQLREICRKHDRDSSLLSGLLNTAADEIVGPKFQFRSLAANAETRRKVQEWLIERAKAKNCDYRGNLSLVAHTKLTLRALWTDGDILHAFVQGGKMQTFEADELATPELTGGLNIVNGLEFGPDGPVVRYWVRPRGVNHRYGLVDSLAPLKSIAAGEAIFPALRKRFSQSRGIPFLASCLAIYDRLDGYLDSETVAAEINARWAMKITSSAEAGNAGDTTTGRGKAGNDTTGGAQPLFDQALTMETGGVYQGLPGENIDIIESKRPGMTFEPYIVTVCRIVGVGVGFPLELLLKDFSKTNFSSARASLNVAHRSFRCWQEILEEDYLDAWIRRQIAIGIALGIVPPDEDVYGVDVVWPAWAVLDEVKQATAEEKQIANKTKSRSQIIRGRGEDPETVFAEIEREEARLGPVKTTENPPPPQRPADEDADEIDPDADEDETEGDGA